VRGTRAAYIGAANGDDPAFYAVFEAAMEILGLPQRTHVTARCSKAERAALQRADLVLLAGGDVMAGWTAMVRTGIADELLRRHAAGCALLGVSAGAVHLGLGTDDQRGGLRRTLGLVPYVIDAHDEEHGWQRLQRGVRAAQPLAAAGLGLPWGGGLVYRPDGALQSVRVPAVRFDLHAGECIRSLQR
jgi:cyanophycinase-like exopeptidase